MFNVSKKLGSLMLLMFVVLGTILSGCSSSTGGTAKADGQKEITFMFRGQPQELKAYDNVVKNFEKTHSNIKVNIVQVAPDQYDTKLKASIAGHKIPDVFFYNPAQVRAFVDSNVLLDITKYVNGTKNVKISDIWKTAVDKYRYDGKTNGTGDLYGLPKDISAFALGYNKTMFEKAGIPLPDKNKPYTWDQFIKVAQQLTKDTNGDGKIDQYGMGFNVNWALQSFVWSNGADWINKKHTKVTITDPKFVQALQFFADQQNKYKVTPSISQAQTLDTYQRWMKGQLAFFPVGPWDMATYKTLPFEYDLMPWPVGSTGKPAAWIGSLGIGVASTTKAPKEATELAMYLSADKDGQKALVDAEVQLPTNVAVAKQWAQDSSIKPENKQEFLNIIENPEYGHSFPAEYTYTSEWYDEFFKNIQPVLDGKMTAEQYCKQEQPKMQKLLDASIQQEKTSK